MKRYTQYPAAAEYVHFETFTVAYFRYFWQMADLAAVSNLYPAVKVTDVARIFSGIGTFSLKKLMTLFRLRPQYAG